jgi:pimeloyl-ACP methyl ester carboxylesterase
MTLLKWLLIVPLATYLGVAVLLYVVQRSLMYFPEAVRTSPAAAGLPEAEEITLDTPDGEKVIVWHIAPRDPDQPVVLYLHGNGGALSHRVERFRALTAGGIGLVALDYRGYGGSTGHPTESGLLIDAATAYAFTAARYSPRQIALWGESLGTGVAVALGSKAIGHLILEAPFTSTVDIAARHYPFVPVRLLMKDQFRSDERIRSVTAPLLILHGARDSIVPIEFGQRLFELAHEPKRFVRYPDGEHDGLDAFGAVDVAKRFLRDQPDALPGQARRSEGSPKQ